MTIKIQLDGTKKFFLADFAPLQPIEPIIKECYHQFKLDEPDDITKAELILPNPESKVYLKPDDYTKRWGNYKIPDGGILIFKP